MDGAGRIAQLVRASLLHREGQGFESLCAHKTAARRFLCGVKEGKATSIREYLAWIQDTERVQNLFDTFLYLDGDRPQRAVMYGRLSIPTPCSPESVPPNSNAVLKI